MAAPTDEDMQSRMAALLTTFLPWPFVETYYGLRAGDPVLKRVERWVTTLRSPREFLRAEGIDRRLLEYFLQTYQVVPRRWAAAELGMTVESFDTTLKLLDAQGPYLPVGQDASASLVARSFVSQFHSFFPSIANRVFSDHSSKCQHVHDAIMNELKFAVEPLWCETSRRVDSSDDRDYAHDFDCLSFEPMGLRHQVWLDFKKPMNLRPDACSELTFVAFETTLRPYLFDGREPEISETLRSEARRWQHET